MDEKVRKEMETEYEEILNFSTKFAEVKQHVEEWKEKEEDLKDHLRSLKAEVRELESMRVEDKK